MKIFIDPGHGGGIDQGAQHYGLVEKDLNLNIALRVRSGLAELGYEVIMSREDDRAISLTERTWQANTLKADAFMSIHFNGFDSPQPEGFEVLYYPSSFNGRRFAELILFNLRTVMPEHVNRGLKERKDLAVLRLTNMPAVLVECEFISNPVQAEWLKTMEAREIIANALIYGANKFLVKLEQNEWP